MVSLVNDFPLFLLGQGEDAAVGVADLFTGSNWPRRERKNNRTSIFKTETEI
jgi:hypothetical protein